MIDERLFADLVELYDSNVKLFKEQNTGFIVDRVFPLTIETLNKIIDVPNEVIDRNYIREHYRNFTINPQIMNVREKFTTTIDLVPDVSWEAKK